MPQGVLVAEFSGVSPKVKNKTKQEKFLKGSFEGQAEVHCTELL